MSRSRSLCFIAGAALGLSGVALGQDADAQRAQAAELLADAAMRTSELAQPDRRFSVDVHGYFQFRYNWNRRGDDPLREEDNSIGFQMARTRLNVSGNVINEDWGYFVQFGMGPDGDVFLEDAYGTFRFETGWQFQFGQFKLPYAREELVGDQYLLAAERSAMNMVFNQGRSQGIQLGFVGDQLRFSAAFSDGFRARNSDFIAFTGDELMWEAGDGSPVFAPVADWAVTARAEWKWAGDWRAARDFTSFQNSDFFGMIGAAGHYQTGGDTGAGAFGSTIDLEFWSLTGDVSVESNGWNIFAAAHYRRARTRDAANLGVPDATYADWGAVVQGGLFITPNNELFARWDAVFPDNDWDAIGRGEDFHTVTIGLNHYFVPESHAAKLTIDFQWFMDVQAESIVPGNTLVGLLPDVDDNQWNLRGQLQILF
jgi:hypothetical protein